MMTTPDCDGQKYDFIVDQDALVEQQAEFSCQVLHDLDGRDLSMSMFVRREDRDREIALTVDDRVLAEIEKLTGELSVEETARTIRHALFLAREAAFKRTRPSLRFVPNRMGLE